MNSIPTFSTVFLMAFTGFGIYEAIKYLRIQNRDTFNYGRGFSAGIVTGFVATLIFTVFFAFYATEINLDFLPQLSEQWFKNNNQEVGIVFFTVAIMGFATSLVLTLSFMQLFKSSNNLKKRDTN